MQRVHGWNSRKDRHPVDVEAIVYRCDGSTAPATLTNLSDDGCRIDAPNNFRIGERLRIAVPRMGQFKAQVRWTLPNCAGAKFLVEADF